LAGEQREAAFMGRITAGVTHEVRNVLAIIRESAGLVQDLIGLAGGEGLPHRDKLTKALATIQGQVNRGVELMNHLNRLAHSPDQSRASLDLNQEAARIAFLLQRFARRKELALEVQSSQPPVSASLNPLGLQMVLAGAVDWLMDQLAPGGVIVLKPDQGGSGPVVEFLGQGRPAGAENPAAWLDLEQAAAKLGAGLERLEGGPGLRLLL